MGNPGLKFRRLDVLICWNFFTCLIISSWIIAISFLIPCD